MSGPTERVLDQLPVFSDVTPEYDWQRLRIDGLVAHPQTLDRAALAGLAQGRLTDDFRCVEGWVAPGQRWEGVPVAALLGLAGPLPEAGHVAFSAGGYTVGMTLPEALDSNVIVALRLNGEPLPAEHGGPCRLIAEGQSCHFSVKWLDRIELSADPPADTGLEIALARNAQRSRS